MILLITFIVAMSSILYELTFAQLMSSILGGTIFQYILTIGFFVTFLGFGSLYYNKIVSLSKLKKTSFFLTLELSLIIISSTSPFILKYLNDNNYSFILMYIVSYTVISIIGFLSGLELPFLMDLFNKKEFSYSGKVLAFDFFGTFLGTILFPLIFIYYFNILTVPIIVASFNMIAIILFLKFKYD